MNVAFDWIVSNYALNYTTIHVADEEWWIICMIYIYIYIYLLGRSTLFLISTFHLYT